MGSVFVVWSENSEAVHSVWSDQKIAEAIAERGADLVAEEYDLDPEKFIKLLQKPVRVCAIFNDTKRLVGLVKADEHIRSRRRYKYSSAPSDFLGYEICFESESLEKAREQAPYELQKWLIDNSLTRRAKELIEKWDTLYEEWDSLSTTVNNLMRLIGVKADEMVECLDAISKEPLP